MCRTRVLAALMVGALIAGGRASAQTPSAPTGPHLPGVTHGGRQLGFQPRHGRPRAPAAHRPVAGRRPDTHRHSVSSQPRAVTAAVNRLNFDDTAASPATDAAAPPAASIMSAPTTTSVPPTDAAIPVEEIVSEPLMTEVVEEYDPDPFHSGMDHWQPPVGSMIWARGEYLLWWTRGMGVPELATTSASGTPQENAGVLGRPSTSVLFGGEKLLDESRSGGRVTLGVWLDPCQQTGVEFSYLGLGEESASFSGSADQFDILARPFFDLQAGNSDARLIVFPELIEGALAIEVSSEFNSAEVSLRRPVMPAACTAVDFYVGYRFAELDDAVLISESTTSLAEPTTGTQFQLDDRFESSNEFHGGQIGIRYVGQRSPVWSTELTGKFALGNTTSRVAISGQTVVTPASGSSTTQPAGLLVQESNAGVFESDDFSTLSEVGLTLRRQLGCGLSVSVGYQLLVWTDVMRAGDQIDTTINVSQIPPGELTGARRPAFPGETTDFWAQGLNFGIDFCY